MTELNWSILQGRHQDVGLSKPRAGLMEMIEDPSVSRFLAPWVAGEGTNISLINTSFGNGVCLGKAGPEPGPWLARRAAAAAVPVLKSCCRLLSKQQHRWHASITTKSCKASAETLGIEVDLHLLGFQGQVDSLCPLHA